MSKPNRNAPTVTKPTGTREERIAIIRELGAGIAPEIVDNAINRNLAPDRAAEIFHKHRQHKAALQREDEAADEHIRRLEMRQFVTQRRLELALARLIGTNPGYVAKVRGGSSRSEYFQGDLAWAKGNITTISDFARYWLARANIPVPANANRSIEEMLRVGERSGYSPSRQERNLGAVFSTVGNAQLLQTYAEIGDSTEDWVNVNTAIRDFTDVERPRLQPAQVGRIHKYEAAPGPTLLADEAEVYQVYRFGEYFQIPEEDFINDRLQFAAEHIEEIGRACRAIRPDMVYSILLDNAPLADGIPLFHADHGNLKSGTGPLSDTTLFAGLAAMAKQRQNGRPLNLRELFLIVPPDLIGIAKKLVSDVNRTDGDDMSIRVRVDDRIGVEGVVNPVTEERHAGSATAWYLAAAPRQAPAIEVGYLNGRMNPFIDAQALTGGRWGIGYSTKFEVGAKAIGYHGIFKDDGTSGGS